MNIKKILIFILVFTIASFGTFAQETKDWTILVYMAADNEEGGDLEGDAWIDLREMMEAKVNSDSVNIVIEADFGSKGYDGRYIIEDGELKRISSYDEINLGDPANLEKFLREGINRYPAKKYMVDFWGHGTGMISMAGPGTIIEELNSQNKRAPMNVEGAVTMKFPYAAYTDEVIPSIPMAREAEYSFYDKHGVTPKRAFAYDESHKDSITLVEVKKVLKSIGKRFNLLSFDACLMNTVEVNYQLKDFTDYIVSAITTFPGGGYWYTGWMKYLDTHNGVEGYELAKAILESNKKYYSNEEMFVSGFAITVKERIKKNLRAQKEAVLEAMAQSNIPESQFEEFVEQYAVNYVNENLDALIENGKKAFTMQTLNFGMVNTNHIEKVVEDLDGVVKTLKTEEALKAFLMAVEDASKFNAGFGEDYGHFYIDTVTFAKKLISDGNDEQKKAAEILKESIYKAEPYRIIINGGKDLPKNRMSIFFPENTQITKLLYKYYAELDFAKVSHWDDILKVLAQKG